jgi:hypothetical protein
MNMKLRNRLANERGQGLVEYSFIVLFVVLMLCSREVYQRRHCSQVTGTQSPNVDSPFSCNSIIKI